MLIALSSLFSAQNFMPHGMCLLWQPTLLALHVLSDSTIAVAYYTIPFALIYFTSRRQDLAFRPIFVLTGAFILACGTTHVMGVVTLWYPAYWLDGTIKLITALVSIGTAVAMWWAMPSALALPSTEQLAKANGLLEHEIGERQRAELALRHANIGLETRVAARTAELEAEVAQRRRTEETLRASEERWRTVFETAAVGIATVGCNLRFMAANPAFQSMVGYTEDELNGMTVRDLTHEDDRADTQNLLDAIVAGPSRSYRREKRYVRKDGATIWVDVNTSLVPATTGTSSFFAGMVIDVTDRKRAEDALRQSEAFLAEAQKIGRIGTYRRSVSTDTVFWSDETFRTYGLEQDQMPGLESVLQRIHPEDRSRVRQYLAGTETRNWEIEYRLLMPDGTIKYVRSLSRSSKDASGNPERIGAVIDITAIKEAEAELNQARAEIARVTRVLTLGEMTAAIAHEINQPLAAVVADGSAGLRWLDADPPNLPEVRQTLVRIVNSANRAADVIGRIRAMATKSPVRMEQLDINEVLQDVIALTRSEINRNRVSLNTQLADDLPPVQGDRVQLQQVILNLVVNAIEAMSGSEPRELHVGSERDGPQNVRVSVEDSGRGLDPAHVDRMFEAFHTTKSGGMGMGLAISRSIIQRHRGRLWASANVGRGAVFRLVLPAGHCSDTAASSTASHEA